MLVREPRRSFDRRAPRSDPGLEPGGGTSDRRGAAGKLCSVMSLYVPPGSFIGYQSEAKAVEQADEAYRRRALTKRGEDNL